MSDENQMSSEKDFLVYKGNRFPRLLRLVWTLFIAFSIFYLIKFAMPDLFEWIKKIKG